MSGLDLVARGLAARADALARAGGRRRLRSRGVRVLGGRTANAKTIDVTGRTYQMVLGLAAEADAVRVIVAVGQTSGGTAITPGAIFGIAPVPSAGEADVAAAAPVTVTFGGSGTVALAPAGALGRRAWYLSDWIAAPSLPRTDGKPGALYAIRGWLYATGAAGHVVMLGDGSDDFRAWETHPSGRTARLTSKGGGYQGAGGWSNMGYANSVADNGCPIVGLQYMARGRVVNLFGFGDSITEGRGARIGEGFGHTAATMLSDNPEGIAFEWSNLGWSGQAGHDIVANALAALDAGLAPDVGVFACGSPNDVPGAITPAIVAAQRLGAGRLRAALQDRGADAVEWTWLPSDPSVKAYGASDALRVAYNAQVVAKAARGEVVADFAARLSGPVAGGQVRMLAGSTSDGVHPNDAGNALLAPLLADAVRAILRPAPGWLAA